ncbi:MAG: BamA/TamA family outer membrane protein [Bacteroidetes bacterium]|nr:BamA/TamA family outer membrane protein [Bacteroidota bacterium]
MNLHQRPISLHFFRLLRNWFFCLAAMVSEIGLSAQPPQTLKLSNPQTLKLSNPQTLEHVTIRSIHIEGNRRTKEETILRELDFGIDDTISVATLTARLQQNEYNILNTGLFTSAHIIFQDWVGETNEVGLAILLQESWYIFPFPIVELADRNFNVWWDTYDHSLRRLNWGVRFYHTNFTGRKDRLKAVVQQGFTKKYELIYTLPYFNRQRTLGLNLNFLHTREKEIGFNTVDNELLFSRNDDRQLLRRLRAGAGLLYRRRLDFFHQLNVSFHQNTLDESVPQELNPDFFLDGLKQRYLSATYNFVLDKRDIRPYPMEGFFFETSVSKPGILLRDGLDALNVSASFQQYFTLNERWSTGLMLKGKTGLRRHQQPYYNSTALGYEPDFIRGYEYYVIDGLDFGYQKSVLRYRLFDRKINWGPYMQLESFREMPVKFFLVLHNELGYVNNPFYHEGNSLANELLWGTSLGLDLVLYYDKVFNFEISRNHLNEYGFFLHWTVSF